MRKIEKMVFFKVPKVSWIFVVFLRVPEKVKKGPKRAKKGKKGRKKASLAGDSWAKKRGGERGV